jgi:uncharacterized membrane protein YeaQ/YmgE (transglycosylase-associated protein family)
MELLYLVLIGIAAGFLAGLILKGKGFGWLINLILGVAGSFLGGWLLGKLGFNIGSGLIGTLITATIGALILVFVVNLIKKKK